MDTEERTLLAALSAQPGETPLLDVDGAAEVADAFTLAFGPKLTTGESFGVGAWYSAPGVRFALELACTERESVLVLEFALPLGDAPPSESPAEEDVRRRAVLGVLVEAGHAWLEQWLADERWPAPRPGWQDLDHEEFPIRFRGSLVNEKLERLADEWLARAEREAGK